MDYTGRPVLSLAGHDKGTLLCVVGTEGDMFFVADGRRRKVQNPKRKQIKHIVFIEAAAHSGPLTNKALRAYLRGVSELTGHSSTN
ncbi:MAG: KOW domain-containing RNA-binding protein [Clostridia bacterium]|nr:KOW domain-containing RNA-binding protein [Clostridia bacterium]